MRVEQRSIDGLLDAANVRIVVVQLWSPFSGPNPEIKFEQNVSLGPPQFVWTDLAHIETRKVKVATLLSSLQRLKANIIVFPEYSLPAESHAVFQPFADENNCVIIPGSYYEYTRDSALFRNNVCTIYLPKASPITIVKKHGFFREEEVLDVSSRSANVARLAWTTKSIKSFSISVFICRDYLIPYSETTSGDHVSLLDWESPGLNVVTMCSSNSELFEGQAAFDVRRMRGNGKFVILCNCTGLGVEGSPMRGSSLLGPAQPQRRKYGDVIEKLPDNEEAILIADLNLEQVALIEVKPDKHIYDPLRSISRLKIVWEDKGAAVNFSHISEPVIRERGVWHPAFLEVMERNIAIQLLTTKRYRRAKEAFTRARIRLTSASSLVGLHDVMVRFYEPMGKTELLSQMPYSSLPAAEFEQLFPRDRQVKLLIQPGKIYKYRTVVIPQSEADWADTRRKIERLLPKKIPSERRRELLYGICRLARDWNATEVDQHARKELAPVFLSQREVTPAIGPETGNCLRQRYVLVSLTSEEEKHWLIFESIIIRQWLIGHEQVRSVYALNTVVGQPQFHFWIDIIADPYQADKIIAELEERCEVNDIEIGIRSMDVMEYLALQSVEGIESTDFGHEFLAFLGDVAEMDEVALRTTDLSLMREHFSLAFECAHAWLDQIDRPDESLPKVVRENVTKFYGYLFCGNFAMTDDERQRCLRNSGSVWLDIYQILEANCRDVLAHHLRSRDPQDLDKAIADHFTRVGKEGLVEPIRGNRVRGLLEFFQSHEPPITFPDVDMHAFRRRFHEAIFAFRRDMTHEDRRVKRLNLLSQERGAQDREMVNVSKITCDLIDTLNRIQEYLLKQVQGVST